MKKELIYPIFKKCSNLISNDLFWKSVYEDLSYGKCPYGITIQKDHLTCFLRGNEFVYKIDSTKPLEKLFQEVNTLLRDRAGILSDDEKQLERNRFCKQRFSPVETTKKEEWTTVKKKMIRDTLLEQYVLENAKLYELDSNLSKKILSILTIGLMFKTITAKDISYQNGFIQKVHGIQFKKGNVIIKKDILRCPKSSSSQFSHEDSISLTTKTLQSFWSLYLDEIRLYK